MADFVNRNMTGDEIHSVEDWFRYAPPKRGAFHWKDGRSARELAKAWCGTGRPIIPIDLKAILDTHPITRGFIPEWAIPEMVTGLDNFPGEGRNQDLGILGASAMGKMFISIEAKADEPFSNSISARITNPGGKPSNLPARIDGLSKAVFGRSVDDTLGQLKYQLLTGLAGALIEAKNQGAEIALFIVHEFISNSLNSQKLNRNAEDFHRFFVKVSGTNEFYFGDGNLHEMASIPGGERIPADFPVLIGKIQTHISVY